MAAVLVPGMAGSISVVIALLLLLVLLNWLKRKHSSTQWENKSWLHGRGPEAVRRAPPTVLYTYFVSFLIRLFFCQKLSFGIRDLTTGKNTIHKKEEESCFTSCLVLPVLHLGDSLSLSKKMELCLHSYRDLSVSHASVIQRTHPLTSDRHCSRWSKEPSLV